VEQARGCLRGPGLQAALRRAGLRDIRFSTTLIERTPPLDRPTLRFWGGILHFFATVSAGLDLPAEDRACWTALREEDGVARFLDAPDLVLTEGNVVVIGRVPMTGEPGSGAMPAETGRANG